MIHYVQLIISKNIDIILFIDRRFFKQNFLHALQKINHLGRVSFSTSEREEKNREKEKRKEKMIGGKIRIGSRSNGKRSAMIPSHLQTLPESLPSSLPLRSKWFFLFRRMMEFHTFLRLIANIESPLANDFRSHTRVRDRPSREGRVEAKRWPS